MKTHLTWEEEKKLQNLVKGKLSLLYKASAHGFAKSSLMWRCCYQGPTLLVIYSFNHVFGSYIPQNDKNETRVSCLLFAFEGPNILECEIRPHNLNDFVGHYSDKGAFLINLSEKKVTMHLDIIKKLKLSQTMYFEECEVFRCEDLLDTRNMNGVAELRDSLLSAIRNYKPPRDLVHQIRILLLGPIGAGKSSFINSIKSVFRGHVTHQALVGSDKTGISQQYRTYSIKDGEDGKSLPFILCDSVGLSEGKGLCMDDIPYILKGHVPDRYQFNFMEPITPGHSNHIDSLLLEDRIHCVAFVFDANSIGKLSDEMVAKIKKARREVIKCGWSHLKPDSLPWEAMKGLPMSGKSQVPVWYMWFYSLVWIAWDLITKGDLIDIYKCMPVKLKQEEVHKKLGFALSDILVVSNYTSEWNLDPIKDVLNLSALRQMLWAADDFLEDLPLEETALRETITKCETEKINMCTRHILKLIREEKT